MATPVPAPSLRQHGDRRGPGCPHPTPAGNGHHQEGAVSALEKTVTRVAAVAAVTAGLAVGVASPAAAAPDQTPGMTLTIHKPSNYNGYYKAYISGVFPMSQADAQWHVANVGNGGVWYDLFGDDPGVGDDRRMSWIDRGASLPAEKPDRYLYAAPDGLRYFRSFLVGDHTLDEDDSWTDDTDEIYARAWFVDRNNQYWWPSTSNVVVRNF